MPSTMPQHWRLRWQMALSVCDTILYYYSMIPWRRVLYNVPQLSASLYGECRDPPGTSPISSNILKISPGGGVPGDPNTLLGSPTPFGWLEQCRVAHLDNNLNKSVIVINILY
eukprot:COSAG01_NODE_3791_length_5691_cov_336.465486_2_plen_113_part_00